MPSFAEIVLAVLEPREAALLSWGVVDGGFVQAELEPLLEKVLQEAGEGERDPLLLLDELEHSGILHRVRSAGPERWRTRSAETVRLLSRLRQLFPRGSDPTGGWEKAPSLVADFRYMLRPRSYPSRDLRRADVLRSIADEQLKGNRRSVLEQLIGDGDSELHLSSFQLRATRQILTDVDARHSRGVIIGAGTGSGKTLAFYLPALSYVADVTEMHAYGTKVLAIYPRTELLRDQFGEAYSQIRKLDALLTSRGKRKLSIGAFYGETPSRSSYVENTWDRGRGGYICPYMDCPSCNGKLIWNQLDVGADRHRVSCGSCTWRSGDSEVVLTREAMSRTPPDVLFTTTEMLNQRMADTRYGPVFGVGANPPPRIVLLDEVHTYEGTTGAQVGMLLRRWQHRIGRPVEFVGLSATLREAPSFFSHLTGLAQDRIAHIEPESTEMERKGSEYLLALRTDPVSGASVLSTTIQTAMALTRTLDPKSRGISGGMYGERTFVFTDALDVVNRLYFDLADAEGWRGRRAVKPSLAVLRNPVVDPSHLRRGAGQSWDLPASLGHDLSTSGRLHVGRTTSQDVGVATAADVVVATAALEVGYNDPTVGAVIQHKAPRGAARFLQRKGRAGRSRTMRPWTVVVLSDYGRDREAYEAYDLLFDPELEPRYLPVQNRYVLRMHAVQAFLDWAAIKLSHRIPPGSLWSALSGPADISKPWGRRQRRQQEAVLSLAQDVLSSRSLRQEVELYIRRALAIDQDVVTELVWEPPRSLFLAALPTLVRRLSTDWQVATPKAFRSRSDKHLRNAPLPDFISPQLFSPLSLPEIQLSLPTAGKAPGPENEAMPVVQALQEFAPGRVSRRYGVEQATDRHWIDLEGLDDGASLNIDEAFEYEELGIFLDEGANPIAVVRPHLLKLAEVPDRYLDSSNAFLTWHTQLIPDGEPLAIQIPNDLPWGNVVSAADAFIHARRAHVESRRFAHSSEAEFRLRNGRTIETAVDFRRGDGSPVGVGVRTDVDGIRWKIEPPSFEWLKTSSGAHDQKAFRSAYFRNRVETDPHLGSVAGKFLRPWLHDLFLLVLYTEADKTGCSLRQAFDAITSGIMAERMKAMIAVLSHRIEFAQDEVEEEAGEQDSTTDSGTKKPRLQRRLNDLCETPEVIESLRRLAAVLWKDPDGDWFEWARLRFLSTLGNGILLAARRLCPEFDPDELLLDLDPGPSDEGSDRDNEIWLTEATVGGAGFVETVVRRVQSDPRRFLQVLRSAFRPTDFEVVDSEIRIFLELTERSTTLQDAVENYRRAQNHEEQHRTFENLLTEMRRSGLTTTHPVVAAISARVLRPGSGSETDKALRSIIDQWTSLEDALGVNIESRLFAYLASESDRYDVAFGQAIAGGEETSRRQRRWDVLQSLLWVRGWEARSRALSSYNPFATHPPADRLLALESVPSQVSCIEIGTENWRERYQAALNESGEVVIRSPRTQRDLLAESITEILVEPVTVGFVFLYPTLTTVQQSEDGIEAHLELRELVV
jgi:ATP-dependent helicase Lhr and Lhr-like helicase